KGATVERWNSDTWASSPSIILSPSQLFTVSPSIPRLIEQKCSWELRPGWRFESSEPHHVRFQLLFSLAFLRFLTVKPTDFDSFVRALAIASRANAACSTLRV